MHTEGTFSARGDPDRAFEFFCDPRQVLDCLDDPHTVEVGDPTHFTGTVTSGVAFIRGTFRITGEYTEIERPRRVAVKLHGSGMGSGLDATVVTTFEVHEGVTAVHWTADLALSGPVASVGERLIRGTISTKTQTLFARARERLEARA